MRMRAVLLLFIAGTAKVWAQAIPLTGEPRHDSGQGIIGAYEGWFPNPDGSFNLLMGYFNRNFAEEIDIPIGPNNRIEPGGPDRGQPTHFYPGRGWGNFVVRVPKDFGGQKLTWTLTVNGKTTVVPFGLETLWEIEPFSEGGMGNTPPVVSFDEGGPTVQGPAPRMESIQARAGEPVTLTVVVKDDAKTFPGVKPPAGLPVVVTWTKFRGPGTVKFSNPKPAVAENKQASDAAHPFAGKATTTATFSEAGEYELNVTANDWSGEGGRGFLCCWTNAHLRVSVLK